MRNKTQPITHDQELNHSYGDGGRASSTLKMEMEMEAKTEEPLFLLSFLLYIQLYEDSITKRK